MRNPSNKKKKLANRPTLWATAAIGVAAILALSSCGGRKHAADAPAETLEPPSDSQRIENLSAALSRAQSRIEELDAKVAVMSDKLEATKLVTDNLAGNKPLKTQLVGGNVAPHAMTQPAPSSDETAVSFKAAMALFRAGNYSEAELSFNRIAESFPEHVLAGSAQFYAGESYYLMGEYKLAATEYEKVISSFSSSPRVATAMVRLSQCHESSGNHKEAARLAALAGDLFAGNPSLDWAASKPDTKRTSETDAAPKAKTAPETKKNTEVKTAAHSDGLSAEPMTGGESVNESADGHSAASAVVGRQH
ncbi:MAG: tetratricopeptide repeat protein [Deltaproteobacteria bacterium]|nr:tetratricopeptide repeat protein [Deltaproteobacteria bacterium]